MQKIYIGVGVVVILIGAYFMSNRGTEEVVDIPTPEVTVPAVVENAQDTASIEEIAPAENPSFAAQADIASKIYTVTFNGTDYEPKSLTIKAGEGVQWVNESSSGTWPASAMHPTHTAYPGSDITKCGTSAAEIIFDACGIINKGETFTFTFTEKGTWKYHDHIHVQNTGSITVE